MSDTFRVDQVVYREDLYPRSEHSPATVQQYADQLENLPPIEVNQRNELIDGWHRWTAHKKAEREEIEVVVTPTGSDNELLMLAIERNAMHGLQLSSSDKKALAVKMYDGLNKESLSKALGVPLRTMSSWLERKDSTLRQEREKRIYDMWLSCHTQQEIAEAVGLTHKTVDNVLVKMAELPDLPKLSASHVDLDPIPIYNVWKQKAYTGTQRHPGNTCDEFVDRLLYLYTKPHDIVVDPFGGSGSTIDVCKKRHRRYWVADRKPIPERASEIRIASIQQGPPALHKRWSDVSLCYLDPPYWKQAEGKYSSDTDDLANMGLEQFYSTLCGFILACGSKMRNGASIALVIQPTQWKAEDRRTVDHVIDIIQRVNAKHLRYSHRISCPYESQQCTPQMVEWAKENHELLTLTREIIIWRVEDAPDD